MTPAILLSVLLAAKPAAPAGSQPPAADPPRAAPLAPVLPLPPPPPPARLPAGAKGGAVRVAVLEPRAVGEVPARPLTAFGLALVPEVRKLEGISAIGMAEIRDMLGFERQRRILGCEADEACMTEIAGALGVDELVTADLVLDRASYALTLKRIDMRRGRVLQSETRRFDRRDGEELLSIVGPGVAALFPERALKPGKTRGVEREAIRRLNPPPIPAWATIAGGGLAAAALVGGGVSSLLASNAHQEYDRLAQQSRTGLVPASDLDAAGKRVRSLEGTRNALLLSGAGIGVAAGVMAFFTDWHGDRAALIPVATAGGAGLVLAGRF